MTEQLNSSKAELKEQLGKLGIDVEAGYPVAKDFTSQVAARHLSDPETLFVVEYLSDGDATRAYSMVFGTPIQTSESEAQALLKKPHIQRTITEIYDRLGGVLVITKRTVIAKLWEIANAKGTKVNEQIKALELIAKMENLMEGKSESDGSGKFQVNVQINNQAGGTKPAINFDKRPILPVDE